MNAKDKCDAIRQAIEELAFWGPGPSPWQAVHWLVYRHNDVWLDWWWRSINKIDIPTWRILRAKVVEIRLRT